MSTGARLGWSLLVLVALAVMFAVLWSGAHWMFAVVIGVALVGIFFAMWYEGLPLLLPEEPDEDAVVFRLASGGQLRVELARVIWVDRFITPPPDADSSAQGAMQYGVLFWRDESGAYQTTRFRVDGAFGRERTHPAIRELENRVASRKNLPRVRRR